MKEYLEIAKQADHLDEFEKLLLLNLITFDDSTINSAARKLSSLVIVFAAINTLEKTEEALNYHQVLQQLERFFEFTKQILGQPDSKDYIKSMLVLLYENHEKTSEKVQSH